MPVRPGDIDQLLREVDIRTDGTGRWTGDFELEIADTALVRQLADHVRYWRTHAEAWRALAETLAAADAPGLTADEFRARYIDAGEVPAP